MQTSDNMSNPQNVHFDDTLAATRGRSNYYFSFATWPIGVGTPWINLNRVAQPKREITTLHAGIMHADYYGNILIPP